MKWFILFAAVLVSLPCLVLGQAPEREVLWSHGQGGNGNTWDFYENLFEAERRINSNSPNLEERLGLTAYANDIQDALPRGTGEIGVLGIGHSNGGLALREVDRLFSPGFENRHLRAIVTVGTPHRGATIVNSIRSGSIQAELNRGCRALTAGPSTHIPGGNLVVQGIATNVLCQILRSLVIDPQTNGSILEPSPLDAAVGSPFLDQLNQNAPLIPLVSVHGNEESPVHWRLVSSLDTDNDSDTRWVTYARIVTALYYATATVYFARGVVGILQFFNPFALATSFYRLYQAGQYLRGGIWLSNSEGRWLEQIGCTEATTFKRFETTIEAYTGCDYLGPYTEPWFNCVNDFCGGGGLCTVEVTRRFTTRVLAASDGFICRPSQIYDPFAEPNNIEAEGVNHSDETDTSARQTRNDNDEMERVLISIFNRGGAFRVPVI